MHLTTSSHPRPFPSHFGFFLYADQRLFLLKRSRTYLSNRRKLILLSFATWLSPTNQNPVIIQAFNRRNHEAFQLTEIFPFTNQCPRNYTCFFDNRCYTHIIFYHHYGKTSFKVFASPYIIRHVHEYRHPWSPVSESPRFPFLSQPFTWFRLRQSSKENVPG